MNHTRAVIVLGLATMVAMAIPYVFSTSKGLSQYDLGEAANSDGLAETDGRLAFPGADGFGRSARGGRGGTIIPVTTLADGGPGSLRACIDAAGPRVCIFRVAGVIRFTTTPPLIHNPFITIAGQTAPGGGVLITHGGGPMGLTPIVVKDTHDVVIRHIRVRTDLNGEQRGSNGAFLFESSHDVIFDHVSGAWSLDQIMSGFRVNDNITISNSIFTEGIPRHDKCALLASHPGYRQMISFVRNLCAHNGDRNPDVSFPPDSCIEIINNVFYNAASQFAEVHELDGGTPVSFIGNVFRRGPNSRGDIAALDRVLVGSTGRSRIYYAGNRLDGVQSLATATVGPARVDELPCPLHSRVISADKAYEEVLEGAGAFPRDALDSRTVREVREQSGRILAQPGELRGPRSLPPIASGKPYADSDGDGMSDAWELANGLSVGRNDAWDDKDHDGWANLEEFLDFAHRQLLEGRTLQ